MTTATETPAARAWLLLADGAHPLPAFAAIEMLMDEGMGREEAVEALHEAAGEWADDTERMTNGTIATFFAEGNLDGAAQYLAGLDGTDDAPEGYWRWVAAHDMNPGARSRAAEAAEWCDEMRRALDILRAMADAP